MKENLLSDRCKANIDFLNFILAWLCPAAEISSEKLVFQLECSMVMRSRLAKREAAVRRQIVSGGGWGEDGARLRSRAFWAWSAWRQSRSGPRRDRWVAWRARPGSSGREKWTGGTCTPASPPSLCDSRPSPAPSPFFSGGAGGWGANPAKLSGLG